MTQKHSLLLFLIVLFAYSALWAQDNTAPLNYSWQTLEYTGTPASRHENAFVLLNDKFYLLGGRKIKDVDIYNPKTKVWTKGAKPPIEIHHFQAVAYDNKIYAIGVMTGRFPNEKPVKNFMVYDPANDKWSEGPEIPENRRRGSSGIVVVGDEVYMFCGIIDGHQGNHVKWVDKYNFKTKKWTILADAPRERDHFSAAIKDGKVYCAGGRLTSGSIGKVFQLTIAEVDVYDMKNNKWETLAVENNIPTKRAGTSSVILNDDLIVIGGESKTQTLAHNEVEAYNLKTKKWRKLETLNRGRHGTQALVYNNKIYTMAGSGKMGGKPELDLIEEFGEHSMRILVFSKTNAFRHTFIPTGIKMLSKMAEKNNWKIEFTEDSTSFNIDNLKKHDVLVFLNTSGNILGKAEEEALQQYFARGGGYVGIHAASDTEKDWAWYTDMVGAIFKNHPEKQEATILVKPSFDHPSTEGLGDSYRIKDEWYNFLEPVKQHVNVLTELDETSYTGGEMNGNHPISWFHHFDGGRVFFTGLGHMDHVATDNIFLKQLEGGIYWAAGQKNIAAPPKDKWTNLLDKDHKKYWDVFMGVPDPSIDDLDNKIPFIDGKYIRPLGLNNDPKEVFTFKEENNTPLLHVSGQIYGCISSKVEYENYHLSLQFKWGEKKWAPRLNKPKDSGILYHCTGAYRSFWDVWMRSQEMQILEGGCGDYYGLANTIMDIPTVQTENPKEPVYSKNGKMQLFSSFQKNPITHCNREFNNENPHGEWNTLELICIGDTSLHIVNGKVVMALYNSRIKNEDGEIVPLKRGKIQIQSEGAEIFYRDIKIKTINEIPKEYAVKK